MSSSELVASLPSMTLFWVRPKLEILLLNETSWASIPLKAVCLATNSPRLELSRSIWDWDTSSSPSMIDWVSNPEISPSIEIMKVPPKSVNPKNGVTEIGYPIKVFLECLLFGLINQAETKQVVMSGLRFRERWFRLVPVLVVW